MCRDKVLAWIIWIGVFRRGSQFSWIGNFFRLPQDVVDIPGTGHLLRFVGIIVLCKVMAVGFLLPYICNIIMIYSYIAYLASYSLFHCDLTLRPLTSIDLRKFSPTPLSHLDICGELYKPHFNFP